MRVLGVARLSRSDDRSTSIERQRQQIEQWAKAYGHELVDIAVDDGVSGDESPWRRPGLGPWLPSTLGHRDATRPAQDAALAASRAQEWQGIVVVHVDRLSRRLADVLALADWCQASVPRRSLFDLNNGLDLTSDQGAVALSVLGGLAQAERSRARDRAKAAQAAKIRSGAYRGGAAPFGYRVDGDRLAVDAAQAAMVREAYDAILGGMSVNQVAARWNAEGRTTARGGTWRVGNLQRLLTSERLLGHVVQDPPDRKGPGVVVRGSDGLPVQRAEPIVRASELQQVRAALASRPGSAKHSDRSNGHLLTGLLLCGECERVYYYLRGHGGRADRYRCSSKSVAGTPCGNRSVLAQQWEETVVQAAHILVGSAPLTRRVWEPGTDHSEEIERLTLALANLRDDRAAGLYSGPAGTEEYRAAYRALEERRQALSAVEGTPGQWVDVPTGQTFAEAFAAAADARARNSLLRALGLRVFVVPGGGYRFEVAAPEDYAGPSLRPEDLTPERAREIQSELHRRASGAAQ